MMAYEQDNHSSGNTKEAEIACYVQLIQSYPKAGMDLGRGLRGPGPKKKNQYVKFSKKKGSGPTWFLAQAPLTSTIPIPASQQLVQTPKLNGKAKKQRKKRKKKRKERERRNRESERRDIVAHAHPRETHLATQHPRCYQLSHTQTGNSHTNATTRDPSCRRRWLLDLPSPASLLHCSTALAFTVHRYLIYHFLQNLI